MTYEGENVQLSEGNTRYYLEGSSNNDDPVIVCLHGLSGGVFVWEQFSKEITKHGGFRLLRYDMYGNGKSGASEKTHNKELFVEQLKDLLDHLKIEKVNLLGHSLGGMVSLLFTDKYPDRVETVTLFSSAGMKWNLYGTGFIKMFPGTSGFFFEQFLKIYSVDNAIAATFFDAEHCKESVQHYSQYIKDSGLSHFVKGTMKSLSDFPLAAGCVEEAKRVSNMNKKIMIVWGQYDNTVPADDLLPQWEETIPNAKFYAVKWVRHDFMSEEPSICCELVTAFVKDEEISSDKISKFRKHKNPEAVPLGMKDKKLKAFWAKKDEAMLM